MPDQYEIDLNNKLKEVLQTVQFLKGSVKDLSTEFKNAATSGASDMKGANSALSDYADTMEKRGIKTVKEFRSEQRLQNYVVKESRQALMAMTMALGFLVQGNDKVSNSTKQVTSGLLTGIAAMEATEFSMFAIGRAGSTMKNGFGNFLTSVSKYGGIISAFVGVGAGLIAFFRSANDEANKAADAGLKKFSERLSLMSPKQRAMSVASIDATIRDLNIQKSQLYETVITQGRGGADYSKIRIKKGKEDEYDQLTADINVYVELRKEVEKVERLERLRLEAEEKGKKVLEDQSSEIQKIDDKLLKLKAAQQSGTLYQKGLYPEFTSLGAQGDEIGRLTLLRDRLTTSDEEKHIKHNEIRAKQEERLIEMGREDDEALAEYNKEMEEADNLIITRIKLEFQKKQITEDQAVTQLRELQTEVSGTKEKLNIEQEILAIQKKEETSQKQFLNDLNGGLSDLATGLDALNIGAESGIQKLIHMAQLAIRIAQTMNIMNARPEGSNAGDYLSILGNILGIFGLFDSGGYTGSGGKYEPAGIGTPRRICDAQKCR